jgi:hypothetical protein
MPNPENKLFVDHINNARSYNRLKNLRFVTRQENNRNRSLSKNNYSGYKGVCFRKQCNKWGACIRINGRHRRRKRSTTEKSIRDIRRVYKCL